MKNEGYKENNGIQKLIQDAKRFENLNVLGNLHLIVNGDLGFRS